MARETAFDLHQHGFRFVNYFTYRLPLRESPVVFGLCGGMCLAAVDYWRRGWPVPEQDQPPQQGSPLYRYLLRRQIVSLGGLVLPRLVRRIFASRETNQRLSLEAWPEIRTHIDAGLPVVLLLVRSEGWENPTSNHQVLCTGYTLDATEEHLDLAIYDPIYPCERITLHMRLDGTGGVRELRHSRGDRVRGFYVARYRFAMPPRLVQDSA